MTVTDGLAEYAHAVTQDDSCQPKMSSIEEEPRYDPRTMPRTTKRLDNQTPGPIIV